MSAAKRRRAAYEAVTHVALAMTRATGKTAFERHGAGVSFGGASGNPGAAQRGHFNAPPAV